MVYAHSQVFRTATFSLIYLSMAGKSGKRRVGKRSTKRGSKRGNNRKLNQAVGMRLMRANVPADPPVRSLTHEHSSVIRVDCEGGSRTGITDFGSFSVAAKAHIKSKDSLSVSFDDLRKLIIAHMGYQNDAAFEMNIRKISVWGSRRTAETTDYTPRLAVDLSDISGGVLITDRGAPNNRPRMGISSPFNLWFKASTNVFMKFYPEDPSSLGQVGVVDISVTWRRFAL